MSASPPLDAARVAVCVPDNSGRLIGKRLPASRFEEAAGAGMPMPNFHLVTGPENRPYSNLRVTGPNTGFRNGKLRIDRETRFAVPGDEDTAWFLADALDEAGRDVEQSPRRILSRQVQRLEAAGLTASAASELEFFLFDQTYAELASGDYREFRPFHHRHGDNDLLVTGTVTPFLDRLTADLAAAGLEVDQVQGEGGTGQLEVNIRPAAPLRAADQHVVFKHVVKARALLEGRAVTFMAKPFEHESGSGGHMHLGLRDRDGQALLRAGEAPDGLAASFLAGILAFTGDFMPLYAPSANSYRRFVPGAFTPLNAAWAWENRSCMIRLTGAGRNARFEFRLPGADCNPYFAYAALFASGLEGVARGLALPPATSGDAGDADLPQLPRDLTEAVARFSGSEVARAALGTDVHDHLVGLVENELAILRRRVTDWDLRRGFETA
jgi:glutamine synthetase